MAVQLDDTAKAVIIQILERGNNAIIRKKGSGVIILEEKRKTVYEPSPNRR
jgi:hypothetical protein